jgi:hypothetical protein
VDIKGESTLSRPFILSLTATILWGLTGVSILQFSVGGLVWGVLLAAAAVVLVAIVAGGRQLRRLEGRPVARANLLLLVIIFAVVGLNELWGLFNSMSLTGSQLLLQLVFTLGLVVLIALTVLNALKTLRSG